MNTSEAKKMAETIESIIKSLAVLVGAIWAFLKFIRTRERHPMIQFDVDSQFYSGKSSNPEKRSGI
jgi:hypothetical protein